MRMRVRVIVGVLALGFMVGACASGGSSSAPAAASSNNAARRGSSTLITESEIAGATGAETIYEVIERLRPSMMRTRGQMGRVTGASGGDTGAGMSTIKVYLNGTAIGDVSMLRGIQAAGVKQVQYLSSSDATTRFGTGHDAGAILITSK